MDRLAQIKHSKLMRVKRVRSKLHGTSERPRLCVHMSNNNVTAQLIDDDNNNTIIYVTSVGTKFTGTMTEKAMKVGHEIATKSKKAKINQVVFDRGAKLYHGRVKALAIAAREEGLEF